MALDVFGLLALFSITITIGYIGSLIFKKTGISDIIWLMMLGLLLGPTFGLIDRDLFVSVLPLLSSLALILILFDSGLNMDFYQVVRGFSRSILLTVVGIFLSAAGVAAFLNQFMGFGLIEAVAIGVMFGGTTTATVTSIVSKARSLGTQVKTVLTLESVLTDPLTIVIPIALLGLLTSQAVAGDLIVGSARDILSSFSVAAVVGMMVGLLWLLLTQKIRETSLGYMLTLAVLFAVYVAMESLNFSGAISALLFGLVIGNRHTFYSMLKINHKHIRSDKSIKSVQKEITFFIRSFFFVYLGLIATVSFDMLIYGAAIVGVLAVVRLLVVEISTLKMRIERVEKNMMRIMVPKGLALAVVSQIPLYLGIPNASTYSDLAFVVILGTNIYVAILSFVLLRKR